MTDKKRTFKEFMKKYFPKDKTPEEKFNHEMAEALENFEKGLEDARIK